MRRPDPVAVVRALLPIVDAMVMKTTIAIYEENRNG
jgi:hypothetical protein